MAIDPHAPLTLRQLEDHLWQAADLFRNKVSNQKDYILALLFFKRASDIYLEETAQALVELGNVPGAEELARDRAWHTLVIPEGHSWEEARNTDEDKLGKALNDALAAIGKANPKQLAGVFERTDFNNKQALPNQDLAAIVDHFHQLGPLDSSRVSQDMLGQAYEWLIAKFAASAGKAGGEFYTPGEVGTLAAALLDPQTGHTVYDPTCGSGGLLLAALERARETGQDARSIFLYGQELNPETWAIARMNMLLHGAGDAATIEREDTLAAPAFLTDSGEVQEFDRIIANPPFSPKNWGHARLKSAGDPYDRIKHLPPKSHGEMAFVQHMAASMGPSSKLVCVLPNGVFFRGGAELAVRKDLIEADVIEAIVQLAPDMFYGAGIPAGLLVCNAAKPDDRKDKVLFIDASQRFERRDTKNVLRKDDIKDIVAAYTADGPIDRFSIFADRAEIEAKQFNLTVRRYVQAGGAEANGEVLSLDEAIAALQEARAAREAADAALDELLTQLEGGEE